MKTIARPALAEQPTPTTDLEQPRSAAAQQASSKSRGCCLSGEVLARVPLSYPTIWALMRDGKFPRSRQVADGKKVVWLEHEINAWIFGLSIQPLKGDGK